MGKILKRKLYVNKKKQYRQIAERRKAKWAQRHQLQHQDQFKFHFSQGLDIESQDPPNKNSKNDSKSDQRVKNRLAAQQSREKRKNYLQELERKIEIYEEMLQTQTCRQCHGALKDKSDTQMEISEQKTNLKDKEISVENYFQEEVIRVDNQGASTPFAIFFFLCLVASLTIFTYHNNQEIDQRILSNYDSLINQNQLQKESEESSIMSSLTMKKSLSYFETMTKNVLGSHNIDQNHVDVKKVIELAQKDGNWKKFGELICTKVDQNEHQKPKTSNTPFLMLRTEGEYEKVNEIIHEESWTKGEVLTCIISQ